MTNTKNTIGCELGDYSLADSDTSAPEIIDAFGHDVTENEQAQIKTIEEQVEYAANRTRLRSEVKALRGYLRLSEEGVLATGEAATRGCEVCVIQDNCDVSEELQKRRQRGEKAIEHISSVQTQIRSREAFGQWRQANKEGGYNGIARGHAARDKFMDILLSAGNEGAARDEFISNVADRLPPDARSDYKSFLYGIHGETVAADQCQQLADKNGWTFRVATPKEDIEEGTDFILNIPTGSGHTEVRIDAKSRNKQQKMIDKNEAIGLRGSYVAEKINQQGNPVLIVSPDGSFAGSGSITPDTNTFNMGKREVAVPSFVVDEKNADVFQSAIKSEALRLANG